MKKITLTFIIYLFSFCAYGQSGGISIAKMQENNGSMKIYTNVKYPNTIICMDMNYHYMNAKLNLEYKFYKVGNRIGYKNLATGKRVLIKKPLTFKQVINNLVSGLSQDNNIHSVFIKTTDKNYQKALQKFKACYTNSVPYSKFINQTTSASSNPSQKWKTIKTFRGSGIKNTSTFTVKSSSWRIVYKSKSSSGIKGGAGHIFQLYLLKPGEKLYEGKIVANQTNKTTIKGKTHIYESGTFYFKSNSANGNWVIKVQVKK